jgi:histidine phosphotransferase ChpT
VFHDRQTLAALIGSRICHDLISPLGAISNGLELLAMSGTMQGPEMDLIAESVAAANAKIRFFRIAFGHAAHGATLARAEIASVLDGYFHGSRTTLTWLPQHEIQRREVKLAFLAIQCLEAALPRGGEIEVALSQGQWRLTATAEKLRLDPEAWAWLEGSDSPADLAPAQAQFAALADLARFRKPGLSVAIDEGHITLEV